MPAVVSSSPNPVIAKALLVLTAFMVAPASYVAGKASLNVKVVPDATAVT